MKKNIFILALVAMFVSTNVMVQAAAPKKEEAKKECCKDAKGDKKACKEGDKKACCKEDAKGEKKACCDKKAAPAKK